MTRNLAQITADIRKASRTAYHRIHSISRDAAFVAELADLFPGLPVIANERCGSWYVPPNKLAGKGYFKSTDGHFGEWSFSLRRANLHLLPLIGERGGCLIVDATRGGKRIPDALSKTIPIWCATLNQVIFEDQLEELAKCREKVMQVDALSEPLEMIDGSDREEQEEEVDLIEHCALHTLPSVVSRSEHEQICARIPTFVQRLKKAGIDVNRLRQLIKKPLRPIWLTPASRLFIDNMPVYDDASFYPIICVSASEAVPGGVTAQADGYMYIQGAADDAEAWSKGLDAEMFWQNYQVLMSASVNDCDRVIADIVAKHKQTRDREDHIRTTYNFIGETTLAIGSRQSGRPPACWEHFDVIINCCELEYEENRDEKYRDRYLFLNIPEGKKGQRQLLAMLPQALRFAQAPMQQGKRVLVHCAKGQDRSVGVALAILLQHLDLGWSPIESASNLLDKAAIQRRLLYIAQYRPQASPSRATLNKVHSIFLGKSHV